MEEFLNRFRQNLEGRPEPEFEEQNWQALQKRLDQWPGQKRRKGLFWWWVAAPLLLLSLASNGLLLRELNQANQSIAARSLPPDTIVQTRTVYHTDTVYKTRILRENPVDRSGFSPAPGRTADNMAAGSSATASAIMLPNPSSFALRTSAGNPIASGSPDQATDREPWTVDRGPSNREPWTVNRLPFSIHPPSSTAARTEPLLTEVPVDEYLLKNKKSFRHFLYAGRPKGFRLGASAGGAYPFRGSDQQPLGFSAGLDAMVEFSPHLQLWAGATYYDLAFTAYRMDPALGVPLVDPPSDDLKFIQAELPQPSLEYSIGMQYVFGNTGKIRPLVGLGFGAVTQRLYDIVYEFENEMTGVEWKYDREIPATLLDPHYLLFRTGLEYKISSHWYGQLRASYRTNWEKTSFLRPGVIGLQAGFMFRFYKIK